MLLAACIVLLAASEECSAGAECADKQNCAKKFGEKYEIEVSEQDPVFTGNEVIIEVKYNPVLTIRTCWPSDALRRDAYRFRGLAQRE